MMFPFPRVMGIFFKSSMVSKSVPEVTESFLFPTVVLPMGMEKSAEPTHWAMVFMFRWYWASFSGINSTLIYSSWPPLTSTLATEDSFSNSGTIRLST